MLTCSIYDLLKINLRAVYAFCCDFTFLLLASCDLLEPSRRLTSEVYCEVRVSAVRDSVIGPR